MYRFYPSYSLYILFHIHKSQVALGYCQLSWDNVTTSVYTEIPITFFTKTWTKNKYKLLIQGERSPSIRQASAPLYLGKVTLSKLKYICSCGVLIYPWHSGMTIILRPNVKATQYCLILIFNNITQVIRLYPCIPG